jgi:hypothetical protein
MLRNNPARPGVQQQWANVGVEMAQVKGTIAVLEARIAQLEGRPVGTTAPQSPFPPGINPNQIVDGVTVVCVILAFPIAFAWARRILRGGSKQQQAPVPNDHTMRLERIEQAVDTIAIEVERISESQRFVTKILAERPSTVGSADASAGDNSASQKQPLQLGAGAMEPIVVQDRERVRQRVITPH